MRLRIHLFDLEGKRLVEITTDHGTIEIVYQMTVGELAIATLLSLLLLFSVLKWFLGLIWRR